MTTEEERLSQIKEWWNEYRLAIIGGTALGIAALGGWTGWNEYSKTQQEAASELYQSLSVAAVEQDYESARSAMDELQADHPNSAYAGQGLLLMARASHDHGNTAEARDYLNQAISQSKQSATVHAARIRLAQLMIADAQYSQALSILDVSQMDTFDSHYFELKGDAYRELGEYKDARDAYQASLQSLSPGSPYERVLRLKLNDTLIDE